MGFLSAILEIIAKYYVIFVIITVFLVLSLIGYLVDKKTRKDDEVTPIFGGKLSLKRRDNTKKSKKEASPEVNNVNNTATQNISAPMKQSNVPNYNYQTMVTPVQENYINNSVNTGITPTNYVVPAATTAQIADTILPNIATSVAQPQGQGESVSAPAMQSIVPGVQNQIPSEQFNNNFGTKEVDNNDDNGAMNFNMND